MSKKKLVLTPFEQAEINIEKTAENFNLYNSMIVLTEALKTIHELEEQDRKAVELLYVSVIQQMSEFTEKQGDQWN